MIPDGGPAFPRSPYLDPDWTAHPQDGMSLRDWFAGQALVLIDNNLHRREANMTYEQVARTAYDIADAMLAARQETA